MNKQLLYYYINNPRELNESSLSDIQELVDEYPYFQTARLLFLKNLHLLDHVRFEPELKRSALYVPDRTRLFELIHNLYPVSDAESEPAISEEERKDEVAKEENKGKPSSIDITGKVESVVDYFGIEGASETLQGGAVDFTFQSNKNSNKEVPDVPEDQLFDYEKSGGLEYSLNIYEHSPDMDQTRSFSDWLSAVGHYASGDGGDKRSQKAGNKIRTASVIDNFLSNQQSGDRKGRRPAETSGTKEIKEQSTFDSDDLMTETLAGIYIKQGHYDKAINIFEKLSLKYPEKSVYFAQQIEKVKKSNSN
jgi:tetratricopeptide (TPR) repeat protein